VAFVPDVATALFAPLAGNPDGSGVRGMGVVTGDPNVAVAVPAVEASDPDPITMGWRGRGNDLNGTRWGRTDSYNNLGGRGTHGEEGDGSGGEQGLFHVHTSSFVLR
jgi:hypothetical protein